MIPVQQRTKLINGFCENNTGNEDIPARKAKVLISTTTLMGCAHNLTRASTCILFEPDWTVKVQRQAFGRVHRVTAKKKTNLYLLWDPINGIENGIVNRQRQREKIGDGVFDLTNAESAAARLQEGKSALEDEEEDDNEV
jgi:SNF2 family DNA or RNA helicase